MEVVSDKYTDEELRKKLQKKLELRRYEHSLGVAYTACSLMMAHGHAGQTPDGGARELALAYTAGLLHDCAKCLTAEERDKYCAKYKVELSETEQAHPYLIHAKLGAVLAREKYGVSDPQILSAIRWHTTGNADMSLLEAVVFAADFIEPNRRMLLVLPQIRQTIYQNLPYAVYLILKQTLVHLKNKGQVIEEHTLKAYEWYQRYAKEGEYERKTIG